MKLCVLETSPIGPLQYRESFLANKFCDFYFVTHDEFHPNSVAFNSGKCWAYNRNMLASRFLKQYDYYWFTDYDVDYKSMTDLGIVDQIIMDLKHTNPAVMVCYDESKDYPLPDKNSYRCSLMTNNQMKIIHSSLIDWFFPMPIYCGGIWDCCHFMNVLEIPFMKNVIINYNVHCRGLISEEKSQGTHESIEMLHQKMIPSFKNLQCIDSHYSMTDYYRELSHNCSFNVEDRFVEYGKEIDFYFDKNGINRMRKAVE